MYSRCRNQQEETDSISHAKMGFGRDDVNDQAVGGTYRLKLKSIASVGIVGGNLLATDRRQFDYPSTTPIMATMFCSYLHNK